MDCLLERFRPASMRALSSESASRRPSLWRLGGLTPWQLLKGVIRESVRSDLLTAASGLAFDWLLALFPMLIFLLALFGIFASHHRQLEDSLFSFTANLLPYQAYGLLGQVADELTTNSSGGKATVGVLLAFWFASGGMSSLLSTLNVARRVPEDRAWWKVRATAAVLTLIISVLLLSALFMVVIGDRFVEWLRFRFQWTSVFWPVWEALQWPAAAVFVAVSFSLIDYFGPDVKGRRWRWLSPGSVLGVLLWLAASFGFRAYLHFFNTYSATYGSLGAVMILLIWLYVAGFAFLIGGTIDAEIDRAARGVVPQEPERPL
jgi:membrane protein